MTFSVLSLGLYLCGGKVNFGYSYKPLFSFLPFLCISLSKHLLRLLSPLKLFQWNKSSHSNKLTPSNHATPATQATNSNQTNHSIRTSHSTCHISTPSKRTHPHSLPPAPTIMSPPVYYVKGSYSRPQGVSVGIMTEMAIMWGLRRIYKRKLEGADEKVTVVPLTSRNRFEIREPVLTIENQTKLIN